MNNNEKIGEVLVDQGAMSPGDVNEVLQKQENNSSNSKPAKSRETIRISADKIDSLIQLIGELSNSLLYC